MRFPSYREGAHSGVCQVPSGGDLYYQSFTRAGCYHNHHHERGGKEEWSEKRRPEAHLWRQAVGGGSELERVRNPYEQHPSSGSASSWRKLTLAFIIVGKCHYYWITLKGRDPDWNAVILLSVSLKLFK